MSDDIPEFHGEAILWANTVLFQSLIVQLIESKILSVEHAERVFDLALERTKKERLRAPDAERYVQHVHANMKFDGLYKWAAAQGKNPNGGK